MPATNITRLYHKLLGAWNRRDVAGMAALIAPNGRVIGFDGTQLDGPDALKASLDEVFRDHATARYVFKVCETQLISEDVAMLRSVAGMVPAGCGDLKTENTAVQTLIAVMENDEWRVVLFQNTPVAWHGRDKDREKLYEELREELGVGAAVA